MKIITSQGYTVARRARVQIEPYADGLILKFPMIDPITGKEAFWRVTISGDVITFAGWFGERESYDAAKAAYQRRLRWIKRWMKNYWINES